MILVVHSNSCQGLCGCVQVLSVDPRADESWKSLTQHIRTDEVHAKDRLNPTIETPGTYCSASAASVCDLHILEDNLEQI